MYNRGDVADASRCHDELLYRIKISSRRMAAVESAYYHHFAGERDTEYLIYTT